MPNTDVMEPAPSEHAASGAPRHKLEVVDVNMTYDTADGTLTALTDISLTVNRGEVVAIVGASGCGKSTLLHIIGGLLFPTTGHVLMDGVETRGPHYSKGIVFQNDAVFPWMTVAENIAYGLRHRRVDRPNRATRAERVEQSLAQVGLGEYRNFYPLQLSGGMRKRVELARAYANEPQVLLLDEPFGALDALTKQSMQLDLSKQLETDRTRTVVLVTHDIEEAVFLADSVIVMSSRPGRISQTFPVEFPRPRPPELITSSEFQELRYRIRGHLDMEVK